MHVANAIDKAQGLGLAPGPEGAGKHFGFVTLELALPSGSHQGFEGGMNVFLQGQQAINIFLLLRLEGIENGLVFTGRVNAPLNAQLVDGFDKAKAR